MDENKKERLAEAGIDVENALERFMGNEGLLERFLKKFLNDQNFSKLTVAIGEKKEQEALAASHTLKGVCGNLSMGRLYGLATEQVNLFRAGRWQEAADLMPQMSAEYETICETLRRELTD